MMQGNYKPLSRASAPVNAVLSGTRVAQTGKVMLSLRVDTELKNRFKAACAARGMTMEQAADEALCHWLSADAD
jgi:hypothetical protein